MYRFQRGCEFLLQSRLEVVQQLAQLGHIFVGNGLLQEIGAGVFRIVPRLFHPGLDLLPRRPAFRAFSGREALDVFRGLRFELIVEFLEARIEVRAGFDSKALASVLEVLSAREGAG